MGLIASAVKYMVNWLHCLVLTVKQKVKTGSVW